MSPRDFDFDKLDLGKVDVASARPSTSHGENHIDFPSVRAQLAANAGAVCQHYLPVGQKRGNEWVVGNIDGSPSKKNDGSFRVSLNGSHAGIRLQWRDTRMVEQTLSVKTHHRKSQEGRTKSNNRDIPMSRRLMDALSSTPICDRGGFLFTRPDDTSWLDYQPNRASKALNKVLKQGCASMGIEPLRVHDLRHTFAYQATMHGADLGDLQHLLGHSDISQTMRYRGWIASRARSVIDKF